MALSDFKVGDKVQSSMLVTEQTVQKFAEMSGDFNPMHMDEAYAKTTRFGKRIAHGMLSGALISRTLATELGAGGIYLSQSMRFMNPVYIGDTITAYLHVTGAREEKGIAVLETIVRNQNNEVCVKGEATIMRGEFLKKK